MYTAGQGHQSSQHQGLHANTETTLKQEAVKETAKAMKALTELSSQVWAEGIRDALQQNGASAPATNGCRLPLPPALHLLHLDLRFKCGCSPAHERELKCSAHEWLVVGHYSEASETTGLVSGLSNADKMAANEQLCEEKLMVMCARAFDVPSSCA